MKQRQDRPQVVPGKSKKSWWRAVLRRDQRFDGRFVYGVRSTGIYCCPSCPSRRPHRKQVVFFPMSNAAERAGFRPCKRCHPRTFQELLEKRRMEEELKVASEIQRRLQPVALPRIAGWEMAGVSSPCRQIGGDYYDFIQRKTDNRVIIALGDVAGKGAGAAILMSSLHAAVRAQSRGGASVGEVMGEINQYIHANTPSDKFLTLFYAELDPTSGVIQYSNAGHPPPLLGRCSGEICRLDMGGLPIGVLPEVAYRTRTLALEPGDVLIIYSDGISESANDEGEEFGESRLIETVQQNLGCSAVGLRDRIGEALSRFVGTSPSSDDRALMIVKRTIEKRIQMQESTSSDRHLASSFA